MIELPAEYLAEFEHIRAEADAWFARRPKGPKWAPAIAYLTCPATHDVIAYLCHVFFAWAQTVYNAALERNAPAAEVRRAIEDELPRMIDEAWRTKHPYACRPLDAEFFRRGFVGLARQAVMISPEWREIQEALARLAAAQAAGEDEDERAQRARRRQKLLEEYKQATGLTSEAQIYSARQHSMHKPEFYRWKRGELDDDSATVRSFERFLTEKKPPIPRD